MLPDWKPVPQKVIPDLHDRRLPCMALPPLLPDRQLICMDEVVAAATVTTGCLGGAIEKHKNNVWEWCTCSYNREVHWLYWSHVTLTGGKNHDSQLSPIGDKEFYTRDRGARIRQLTPWADVSKICKEAVKCAMGCKPSNSAGSD